MKMPNFPADSNDDVTIPGQTQRESDPAKQQQQADESNQRVRDLQTFLSSDCQGWRGMSNGWHDRESGN